MFSVWIKNHPVFAARYFSKSRFASILASCSIHPNKGSLSDLVTVRKLKGGSEDSFLSLCHAQVIDPFSFSSLHRF
jgi:hypothetical protein